MIAPIQSYAIKGVFWYQGESNARTINRIEQYPLVFRTLVESWRAQWGINFPVYYVQLAPYMKFSAVPQDDDTNLNFDNWAWMRESQAECLVITNTAMACIIDSGMQNQIHPPYKDRAGERLARIAAADSYGINIVSRGPTISNVQMSGPDVVVTFDHIAGGLQTRAVDAQPDAQELAEGFPVVSVSSNELAGFALCGTDQVFYWASGEIISSNQVRISNAAKVPHPVAVRYAWQSYPRCNLFNSEGLLAEPFRTDSYGYKTSSGAQ
jgi:sialate O-acetylesterase